MMLPISRKATVDVLLCALLIGCGVDQDEHKLAGDVRDLPEARETTRQNHSDDPQDFFRICDSLDYWYGTIQGLSDNDPVRVYPTAVCHSIAHYDLIWVPMDRSLIPDGRNVNWEEDSIAVEENLKYSDLMQALFENEKELGFKSFACYAFALSKKFAVPVDDESEQVVEYVFPCVVQVFRSDGGEKWELVQAQHVRTLEELGRLKVRVTES